MVAMFVHIHQKINQSVHNISTLYLHYIYTIRIVYFYYKIYYFVICSKPILASRYLQNMNKLKIIVM